MDRLVATRLLVSCF